MKNQNLDPEMEKRLPMDLEAEKVVLSSLIRGSEYSASIFEVLQPEFFFGTENGLLFAEVKHLWEKNEALDLPAVVARLDVIGKLASAGGGGYISSLVDSGYFTRKPESYVEKIRHTAARRSLIYAMERARRFAMEADDVDGGFDVAVDFARNELASIARTFRFDRSVSDRDAAIRLVASLRDTPAIRANSGIKVLDEYTGGFQAGELVILTAETGAGKTFFALQVKRESCRQGNHVLFCSGEMRAQHLMGRVLAGDSRVSHGKIRRPEFITDHDLEELVEASLRQCTKCTILDDELTLPRIRQEAIRRVHAGTSGPIIVDYDELVEVRGQDTEWEEQRLLVRSMKALAMELRVPMIVVSQLRKALNPEERKYPTLQRLYGSGAKAKHASIVVYIDRPFVTDQTGDETAARICVLKNRDGRLGQVDCSFNIRSGRFEDTQERDQSLPYKDN